MAKKRICIVDDNEFIRTLIIRILENAGVDVDILDLGSYEGVDIDPETGHLIVSGEDKGKFDCIICDNNIMGGKSGVSWIAEQIKKCFATIKKELITPIIFHTQDAVNVMKEMGAPFKMAMITNQDIIIKPCDKITPQSFTSFINLVKELLGLEQSQEKPGAGGIELDDSKGKGPSPEGHSI